MLCSTDSLPLQFTKAATAFTASASETCLMCGRSSARAPLRRSGRGICMEAGCVRVACGLPHGRWTQMWRIRTYSLRLAGEQAVRYGLGEQSVTRYGDAGDPLASLFFASNQVSGSYCRRQTSDRDCSSYTTITDSLTEERGDFQNFPGNSCTLPTDRPPVTARACSDAATP